MKKLSKILLSTFVLMMLFSSFASLNVMAVETPDQTIAIPNSDSYHTQLQANLRTMFRFRQQTQLTFHANINMNLDINCEALRIGAKDFIIEIDGDQDLYMNMTCTHEENQLGLQMGNIYRIRNRNMYQYKEGFVCYMQCNGTFLQARLRIRATNENRVGTWAYYDEATSEWVSIPTTIEDGYLTATVDHFSYWTILIPDNTTLYIVIGVGVAAVAAIVVIAVMYLKKRK